MTTRSLSTLITAATAVAALAAGLLLAINAPLPASEEFNPPALTANAAADEA